MGPYPILPLPLIARTLMGDQGYHSWKNVKLQTPVGEFESIFG